MHEQSGGVLAAVVRRFIQGEQLTAAELIIMRDYCRQWIDSPAWDQNPHGDRGLAELGAAIDSITSNETLRAWLQLAEVSGADPL